MKRFVLPLVLGLALMFVLLGGTVALSHATSAASAAPAQHSLADVADPPPGH